MRRSNERELRPLEKKFHPLTEDNYPQYEIEQSLILHPTYAFVAEMLEKKARRFGIRVPSKSGQEGNENWAHSSYTGDWMLTPEAERKLRNEIREEQRARNDEWRKWATLAFAIIGTLLAVWSLRMKQKQPDPCPVNYYRNDSGACVFALSATLQASQVSNKYEVIERTQKEVPNFQAAGTHTEVNYVLLHDGHKIYAACDLTIVDKLDPTARCGLLTLRIYDCAVQPASIFRSAT